VSSLPKNTDESASPIRAMRVPDACRSLGISKSQLYRELRAGRLIARKCGSVTLIPTDSADKWLNSLPEKAA